MFKLFLFAAIAITSFASCSNKQYSPLDTYVNGTIERSADSARHAQEVKLYLDSLNN